MGSVWVCVEDAAGQLAGDQHRLHSLPHGLLRPQGQLKAALGAALSERDVVLDVDRDGHQTEGRTSRDGQRGCEMLSVNTDPE